LLIRRIQLCILLVFCAELLSSCSRNQPGPAVHLAVTMRKFAVEPKVVRVNQGEKVVLDVSSKDVQHGFQVEQLGINEPIQPGKSVAVALDTSKKGQFRMECSIICGAGHDDMTGTIVVE
jgi:cytochrome c oxidase subunit 2